MIDRQIEINEGDFFSYGVGQRGADQYVKSFGSNPLVYMIIQRIAFTSGSINRVVNDKDGNSMAFDFRLYGVMVRKAPQPQK